MSNVNNFVSVLNSIAEKTSINVYLPSLKREVRFKTINAKQHKDMYSCLRDNKVYNTNFIITTYNIIKNNCLEPEVVNQINIIDKTYILLALRKSTLGPIIKNRNINFDECLNSANTIVLPDEEMLLIGEIKIVTQIPLLEETYKMEIELRGTLQEKKITIETLTEELIINSCCKYIKEVWINDKSLNVKAFNYKDRLTIVENLPAIALTSLQEFAKKISTLQDNITNNQFYINTDFFLAE